METQHGDATRAVSRVKLGFKTWSRLSLKSRIRKIRKLRKMVSQNARRIAEAISEDCHRPMIEALSQEVLPVLEMAKYCEKKFPMWLARRKLPYQRPGFWQKKNALFLEPIGPVAVFSPQNFPFSLGLMTLIYALLPGNTVILKPSERSRRVSSVIEKILKEAGLITSNAAVVLPGDAKTGQRLIRHPQIKKIFFFGHRRSGKEVADSCVKHSKPYVLEAGGGCTAFVAADANVKQAAAGLAWSSFYVNGQSCVSTERIFIDERIADKFIPVFRKKVMNFQSEMLNEMMDGSCHSLDVPRLDGLIEDARKHGADVFRADISRSEGKPEFFKYTVIFGATNSMGVLKEEIFGPVVAVQRVPNLEEKIVRMADDNPSMGISIWSRKSSRAYRLARKMSAGMIWINDSSFGLPHLPWGGFGRHGSGSLFSEFSIHEVTRLKWVSQHPGRFSRKRFWWNPYSSWKKRLMIKIAENFF